MLFRSATSMSSNARPASSTKSCQVDGAAQVWRAAFRHLCLSALKITALRHRRVHPGKGLELLGGAKALHIPNLPQNRRAQRHADAGDGVDELVVFHQLIPVVLLGTFGIMSVLGFSINTLTMFGLVLAIGLLVDDAIVVVENVERIMAEEGLPPREATRKSMRQITGALIGVALVLSAVFVPTAFFKGSTGAIYRQFSITIVSAMILSVLVALVLTPALCASVLKPAADARSGRRTRFNQVFDKTTRWASWQ